MATYRTIRHLHAEEAAYLAGLIDGEGTVSLLRRHRLDNRQLVISISSTEMGLLKYVRQIVGAGRITNKRTYSEAHTPSGTYIIENRQALALLAQVAPFLKTYKAQRAALILREYVRLTPRNGKYTEAIRAERKAFVEAVLAIKPSEVIGRAAYSSQQTR